MQSASRGKVGSLYVEEINRQHVNIHLMRDIFHMNSNLNRDVALKNHHENSPHFFYLACSEATKLAPNNLLPNIP